MLPLDVDGISGEDVKDFLVSRDGSRLIAVIRENAEEDSIVVSRILTHAVRARWSVPSQPRTSPTPTTWTARSGTSPGARRPASPCCTRSASGSSRSAARPSTAPPWRTPSVTIDEPVIGLIGTPVEGEPIYAFTKSETRTSLADLAGPRGERIELDPGLTMLAYVS